MIKTTFVLLALGTSVFATGTSSCSDPLSSGCGQWWMTYTMGEVSDGSFNRSTGVATSYTSNYTNVSASQEPLAAVFSWMGNSSSSTSTSTSTNTTSSYSPWVSMTGSSYSNSSSTTTTGSSGSYDNLFVSLSSSGNSYTNNVASSVPTDTSGSVGVTIYSSYNAAYQNYVQSAYNAAYGPGVSSPGSLLTNPSPIGAAADIANPEPGSIVAVGLGLALVAAQLRRRNRRKLQQSL